MHTEDACVNLIQEMELANENSLYYEDPDKELSQEELLNHEPEGEKNKEREKKSKWGPVLGARQSARFADKEGKTMLQKAQEITTRRNLEKTSVASSKLKGIAQQNPFSTIATSNLVLMANTVGVAIPSLEECSSVISVHSNNALPSSSVSPSPSSPLGVESYEDDFPDAIGWSVVGKHRRGKHPKKNSLK
jgi:hypothetical protein